MLQKLHDSSARWVAFVLLALVSVGFVFWRADFSTGRTATFAAKVNGENLSLSEFDRELQAQQTQFQQRYRTELSEELRRELRRSVVESMIRDAVLKQRADEQGYRVSLQRLSDYVHSIAAFHGPDEKFDDNVYKSRLALNGMTPIAFELRQRDALAVYDLTQGIADSTFLTPAEFRRYIELYNQRREVGYAMFPVDAFLGRVTIDEPAIAAHYEANQAKYQTTETVDLEYLELTLADIAATVEVSEETLRQAYEEDHDRFQTPEERHARHILIQFGKDEDAARAKAAAIAERARKGEDFAKLAAEVSEDAGTKRQGGDLGWMTRRDKAFETALFGLQAGAISDPVRSDSGFHVIKLEEIRPGSVQPFEAVRAELAEELKTRRAEQGFNDRANRLADRAFDAYNELATVATELNLPLKTLMGFPRTGDPAVFPNGAPVVQAAFDEQTVDSGRNSALVELAQDNVLVLRVTAHHLPAAKPLAEVQGQIRDELKRARGQELAEAASQAFLAGVEAPGADAAKLAVQQSGTWTAPALVERTNGTIPTEVLARAFALEKPAKGEVKREHVALADGSHAVLVLSAVQTGVPDNVPQTERDQRQRQLADQAANAELTGYVGTLRERAKVRIPDDVLEPQY